MRRLEFVPKFSLREEVCKRRTFKPILALGPNVLGLRR